MLMSIANREYPRTAKLYDRTSYAISLDEIKRIVLTSLALDCANARECLGMEQVSSCRRKAKK